MPELVLKVGSVSPDPAHYQDGDVLCAFNRRRIRACHAEMICHPDKAGFTKAGLRPFGTGQLAWHWYEATHEYRFERVSQTEVERVTLLTGAREIAVGMDARQHLTRRLAQVNHQVFGVTGREFWYGGNLNLSNLAMNVVWSAIENFSVLREADHQLWPLTEIEKKHFLALSVEDFTDQQRERLERPDVDEAGRMVRKRLSKVEYADLDHVKRILTDVQDRTRPVDIRDVTKVEPLTIVVEKSRMGVSGVIR